MSALENLLDGSWRRQGTIARVARWVTVNQVPVLLALSIVSAIVLVGPQLDEGWFHHDDGSFAHSAERVLAGELPHKDFADLYTGLLTFMNAGVFAVLGDDLFNLRLPLFTLFLAYVGCFFSIARRVVSPLWAFVATLFAISWSIPVFPVPVSSWYLIFLWTIGTYAVVRFLETNRKRWLFVAGACGGVSIAVKIVGIWYVTAVVLALLVRPFQSTRETASGRSGTPMYPMFVIVAALFTLALVSAVVSGRPGRGEVAAILIPVAALCCAVAALGRRAWRNPVSRGGRGLHSVGVFIAGVAAPLVLFLVPYAFTGSIGDLIEGALITPRSRLEFASASMPAPRSLLWAVPVIALFLVRSRVASLKVTQLIDLAAGGAVAFLVLTASSQPSYSLLWDATRALAPFVIFLGALAIVRPGRKDNSAGIEPELVTLLVLVGGFALLIQFPFGPPVYFVYAAPLVLLAAVASMRHFGLANGLLPGVLLIALVAFGVRQLDSQTSSAVGHRYEGESQLVILDGTRASVRVSPETKAEYDSVRALVAQHSPDGGPIFAGPDAPEIYFLTHTENPTPSIMDFLDQSGTTRGSRLLQLLKEEDIRVVVLNHGPLQSAALAPETVGSIRSTYAGSKSIGRFEVRWIVQSPLDGEGRASKRLSP